MNRNDKYLKLKTAADTAYLTAAINAIIALLFQPVFYALSGQFVPVTLIISLMLSGLTCVIGMIFSFRASREAEQAFWENADA